MPELVVDAAPDEPVVDPPDEDPPPVEPPDEALLDEPLLDEPLLDEPLPAFSVEVVDASLVPPLVALSLDVDSAVPDPELALLPVRLSVR